MQDLPHHYQAAASSRPERHLDISSPGLDGLESAPPAEFGGPGDRWSPETLLVAAIAGCFVLTFKSIARASKFEWTSVTCEVEGVLDRVDSVTRFVSFHVRAVLDAPPGTDERRAKRLLDKAEENCLVTRSLSASTTLDTEVRVAREP
jgi:organic hydroperoxide reductase OsmC/OhrA